MFCIGANDILLCFNNIIRIYLLWGAEGRVFESCRPDHYLAGFSVPVFAIVFAVLVSEAFSQRRIAAAARRR